MIALRYGILSTPEIYFLKQRFKTHTDRNAIHFHPYHKYQTMFHITEFVICIGNVDINDSQAYASDTCL